MMVWQTTFVYFLWLLPLGKCLNTFQSGRTQRRRVIAAAIENKRINGNDNGGLNGDSGINGDFLNGGFDDDDFFNGDFFPRNEVNGYVVTQESGYHRFLNKGHWRELRLRRRKSLEQMKNEENEDGYADMRKKPRPYWKRLLRLPLSLGERVLPKERPEPGTLVLVRHGESTWNANKTFTGTLVVCGFFSEK